jgi:hypothetical protein
MENYTQPALENIIAKTREPLIIKNKDAIIEEFDRLNNRNFTGKHHAKMDTLLAVAAAGCIREKRPVPQPWFISVFSADAHEFHTSYQKAFPKQSRKYAIEDYLGYYAGIFGCDLAYVLKLYKLNDGLKSCTPHVGAAAILCAASPRQDDKICSALGTTQITIRRKQLTLCRE